MSAVLSLTPELAESLANAVAHGVPIETASRAAGIHPNTFYGWLRAGKNGVFDSGREADEQQKVLLGHFVELIGRAEAEWEQTQVLRLNQMTEDVNQKTGLRDWRATMEMLKRHPRTRERWREHREVTIDSTSTVTHEHRMTAGLDISELDKLEREVKALASPDND